MPTPDLLTLIRRACEGTPAEGLKPDLDTAVPYCLDACPHYHEPNEHYHRFCGAIKRWPADGVCIPAVEALARRAVEKHTDCEALKTMLAAARRDLERQVAKVERLTAELAAATANPSMPSNGCEPTE